MASWMVHLRIADYLLERLTGMSDREFLMGNIAPDSGIPNADWSVFTPSSEVSHFRTTDEHGLKEVHEDWYIEKYFTGELRSRYDIRQYSFYLGYLTHLLTDKLWVREIVRPLQIKYQDLFEENPGEWWRRMKKEWHDLDIMYLRENPGFRTFVLYEGAVGFQNTYLDIFSRDAFDNRREYITTTYREECETLECNLRFLSEEEIAEFVCGSGEEIIKMVSRL